MSKHLIPLKWIKDVFHNNSITHNYLMYLNEINIAAASIVRISFHYVFHLNAENLLKITSPSIHTHKNNIMTSKRFYKPGKSTE